MTPEREQEIRDDDATYTSVKWIGAHRRELLALVDELRQEHERLKAEVTNLTSTVEAWNHREIMKCGCHYSKVWGGTKWEHWLVPCKEHHEVTKERDSLSRQVKIAVEALREYAFMAEAGYRNGFVSREIAEKALSEIAAESEAK